MCRVLMCRRKRNPRSPPRRVPAPGSDRSISGSTRGEARVRWRWRPTLAERGAGRAGSITTAKLRSRFEPGHLGRNGDLPAMEMQRRPSFEVKSRSIATRPGAPPAGPSVVRRRECRRRFRRSPPARSAAAESPCGRPRLFPRPRLYRPRAFAPCHVPAKQFGFDLPRRRGNVVKPQLGNELAAGPHRRTLPRSERDDAELVQIQRQSGPFAKACRPRAGP